MAGRRKKRNDGFRNQRLVTACCLLFLAAGYGYTQDFKVTQTVQPEFIKRNETVRVRIEFQYPYADQVYPMEPSLPEGLKYDSGPFKRPVRMEGLTVIEYTLRAEKAGRYIIPPFILRFPYGRKETAPIAVFVEDTKKYPIDFSYEVPLEKLYEGQAVPVFVWANLLRSLPRKADVRIQPPKDIILRPMENTSIPQSVPVSNMDLLKAPLAAFMLHFRKSGDTGITEGKIIIDGTEFDIPPLELTILPLPVGTGEDDGIYGVGDVIFSTDIKRDTVGGLGIIKIIMRYSGTGNHPFFRFPEVYTRGMEYVRTTEQDQYGPLLRYPYGYSGNRRKVLHYRQLKEKEGEISIPEVRIFNPDTGRTVLFPDRKEFVKMPEPLPDAGRKASPSITTLPPPHRIGKLTVMKLYTKWWVYLFFIPGILFICICMSLPKLKSLGIVGIVFLLAGCAPDTIGKNGITYPSAEELYRSAFESVQEEEYGKALFYLRIIHRGKPMNRKIISIIADVENSIGIEHQAAARWSVHPDVFLLSGLFIVNGAGFLCLRKKKDLRLQGVLLLLLLGGMITGLTMSTRNPPIGVLREDTALRIVPAKQGEEKLLLREGTSLELINKWKEYHQVQTGDKIIGWVEKTSVYTKE